MSKCEHNRCTYYCKECKGGGICEHNKIRYGCKECHGAGRCDKHNKLKTKCKECGGSRLCTHGKQIEYCRECGGSAYCEHDKRKTACTICKGSEICEHDKRRYNCRECKGGVYCQHLKIKAYCIECGGSARCEHGNRKDYCKECGGKQICQHKKIREICKECCGSQICTHGKYKRYCVECEGSYICLHKIRKDYCRECGNSYCEHGKKKTYCKTCDGRKLCKSSWCEVAPSNKKYLGYCLHCFIHIHPDLPVTRNYKTKEKATTDTIVEAFPDLTWIKDKKVEDGCSRRRPDLYADLGSHILIVEIDENQHMEYDCSCENKRLMEISKDFAHRPVVFIRFNPDDYIDTSGNKISSCWRVGNDSIIRIQKSKQTEWDMRVNTLKEQIKYWIDNTTSKTLEVVQLFFDQNTKARGGAG